MIDGCVIKLQGEGVFAEGGMEEKLHYILMGGAMTSSTTLWQVRRRVNPPGAEESWEIRFLEVTG